MSMCVDTHVYPVDTLHATVSTPYQVHTGQLDLSMTSDLHGLSGNPVGLSSLPGMRYTSPVGQKKKKKKAVTQRLKAGACVCVFVCMHGGGRAWGRDFLQHMIYTHALMLKEGIR